MLKTRNLISLLLIIWLPNCKSIIEKTHPSITVINEKKAEAAFFHLLEKNNYFKLSLFKIDSVYKYIIPAKDGKSLLIVDAETLNQEDSIKIDPSWQLSKFGFEISLDEKAIYNFDDSLKILSEFKLQGKQLVLISQTEIPSFSMKDRYFMHKFDFRVLKSNQETQLLVNYGLNTDIYKNFTDTTAFVLFGKKEKKIVTYPEKYRAEMVYNRSALFDTDNDGNLYFTYELYDSIYARSPNGTITYRNVLHQNPKFSKFNSKKESDISYIRRYTGETEKNANLKVINDKYIVIIKKLHSESILAPKKFKYFVMDKKLNILYADTIKQRVTPFFLSGYKNGFVLFADSVKAIYHYEIN